METEKKIVNVEQKRPDNIGASLRSSIEEKLDIKPKDEKPQAPDVGNIHTAPEFVYLVNSGRISQTINSVTGDSLVLPVGRHKVPGIFNWNLPENVSLEVE